MIRGRVARARLKRRQALARPRPPPLPSARGASEGRHARQPYAFDRIFVPRPRRTGHLGAAGSTCTYCIPTCVCIDMYIIEREKGRGIDICM